MIRRAASYAVAASIGTVVGTFTGAIIGAVITTIMMSDERSRAVVINHYRTDDSSEDQGLQPQDATLDDVNLSSPSAE